MKSAKQVFTNLVGCWRIRRVLGSYGHGEGLAQFTLTPDPFTLNYREDIEVKYTAESGLKQPGVSGTAYQEYVYLFDEERDKIIKRFVDGRHFYELKMNLETLEGEGEHLCEKDLYQAKYKFQDSNHFTLSYDVKGPEKEYVIQTLFTRDDGDGVPSSDNKDQGNQDQCCWPGGQKT